ncbi:MAG: amidase, partial [Candidatus Andersenbacteria bacterium]
VRGRGFGPEVKRAILMGTYALSSGYVDEWYGKASKVRTLIRQEYEQAFQGVDVIVGPVAPEPAFELGSKTADPLAMYLGDAYTVPVSVAGLPAMSVPCGMTKNNLPVGLQIIAPHFREEVMFQVGSAYEDANTWKNLMPKLPQ